MSVPSVELRPKLGVRKPERRRSPTGKPRTGDAKMGTPWKYSRAELAVADSSSVSISIFSAWIHHASSPGAQVVKRACVIRACWLPRNSTSPASTARRVREIRVRHRSGLLFDLEVQARAREHRPVAEDTRVPFDVHLIG